MQQLLIAAVIIAAVATLIGVVGDFLLNNLFLVVLVIAGIGGGIVFLKMRTRARNTV